MACEPPYFESCQLTSMPFGHGSHACDDAPSATRWLPVSRSCTNPATQVVHSKAPTLLACGCSHEEQLAAPCTLEYVDTGHSSHVVAPSKL